MVQYTHGSYEKSGAVRNVPENLGHRTMSLEATSQTDCQLVPSPQSDHGHIRVQGSTEEVLVNVCSLPCSQGCCDQRGEALCPHHRAAQAEAAGLGSPSSQASTVLTALLSACGSLPAPNKTFLPLESGVVDKELFPSELESLDFVEMGLVPS